MRTFPFECTNNFLGRSSDSILLPKSWKELSQHILFDYKANMPKSLGTIFNVRKLVFGTSY